MGTSLITGRAAVGPQQHFHGHVLARIGFAHFRPGVLDGCDAALRHALDAQDTPSIFGVS